MKVYLVWYYNPKAFGYNASLYGIYLTREKQKIHFPNPVLKDG